MLSTTCIPILIIELRNIWIAKMVGIKLTTVSMIIILVQKNMQRSFAFADKVLIYYGSRWDCKTLNTKYHIISLHGLPNLHWLV